jgi:ADP-heptose:LPS heptosyltransferase
MAAMLLREVNPESRPLVVLVTQNSGGQNTGWHTDRFCKVIQAMHARGYAVAYVGTEGDVPAIAALIAAAGDLGVSIAGRTTVTELAAVLALSDLMVTLDTGTMHVGRAAGVPMVVLGPSWQEPLEWLPIKIENVRVLRGESVARAPADYRLDEISPESVIEAGDNLLALYPPLDESRRGRLDRALSDCDHRMV